MKRIETYREYWPYYLHEHRQKLTRQLHLLGTAMALVFLFALMWTGDLWYLPLSLGAGYGFAWLSHATVEHNQPASFRYPMWSLISDFRMFSLFLLGKLEEECERHGVKT